MGKYDRLKYKQIIINVQTKTALDKVKELRNIASYNDAINVLIKQFYAREYQPVL